MNINFSIYATFLQRQSWLLWAVFSKGVCNFFLTFSLKVWGWFLWHFFSKGSCEPPVVEHGQVSGKGNDNSWVGTISCANGFTLVKLAALRISGRVVKGGRSKVEMSWRKMELFQPSFVCWRQLWQLKSTKGHTLIFILCKHILSHHYCWLHYENQVEHADIRPYKPFKYRGSVFDYKCKPGFKWV